MNFSRYFLPLLCLGSFVHSSQSLEAAHAMGGEVYYDYLGGGDFEVTLVFYRECDPDQPLPSGWQNGGTNLDPTINLGVFEGANPFGTYEVQITMASTNPLDTELENPCGNLPPDLCVQRLEYKITINLPSSEIGYDLVFQRCCRNPGISNIPNPGDVGITLTTQIPPFTDDAAPNSSPQFNNFPPEAICTGFDFYLDQSATDADGDSLVYSFCTPLNGGSTDNPSPAPQPASTFTTIPWGAGFSALDPIPSNPSFEINPETGEITGFPTTAGAYVIGICVSEYRDGELLSTVMRDFQFNVVMCDPTIISAAQPQADDQFCIGETIEFSENSIGAQSLLWDFGVPGITTDISTASDPVYTYPDTGIFEVMLIANPSWPCADTSSQVFYIYEPIDLSIEMIDFECLSGIEAFDLEASGAFTENTTLAWSFLGGLPSTGDEITTDWITFNNTDEWTVTLDAEHYGCQSSTQFTWDAPETPVASIADQSSFCQGFDFDFENLSSNGTNWSWDFGVYGDNTDISNDESPSFTYPGDGVYTVQLVVSAPYTCSDTAFATIEIFPEIDPSFEAPDPECFSTNNFTINPLIENDPITEYEWDFGGATVSANINGPQVSNLVYTEPGTYTVEVTATANGCEVTASEDVWVIVDPSIGFQGGPPIGCPPHSVSFTNTSETETATTYLWDFGDGSTSIAPNPVHVYQNSGDFSVTLTMNASGYCSTELILAQPNLIEVYPVPDAGFDITPNQVDILNPNVEFESLASGNVDCFYNFGDGGSSNSCNGSYTFSDGGLFNVVQTVVNEAGCTNTAIGQVAVSGSVFYAPNAFTPNHDGLNDVWQPVALGITQYHLQIYNRWGEMIWETWEPNTPWLGQVKDGQHFAIDGLYFYEAWTEDQLQFPRTYSGIIQLTR